MSVGKIGAFQLDSDNWTLYVERLEQYFVVNNVKEELKVPTLITVMGGAGYELLVTLCTPEKPASKKFDDLVKIMCNHLQPKPSILAERYTFRKRKQAQGESIAEYIAELRRLSKHCGFGESLQESLRDQLVCGLSNDTIRQRLFAEEDLAFDKALRLAVAIEAAELNAALVEGREGQVGKSNASEGTACNAVGTRTQNRQQAVAAGQSRGSMTGTSTGSGGGAGGGLRTSGQRSSAVTRTPYVNVRTGASKSADQCGVCGRDHDAKFCKFKNYVCRVCNQPGHLKKMCPRQQGTSQNVRTYNSEVHEFVKQEYTDGSSDEVIVDLYNFDSLDRLCGPIEVEVSIDGSVVTMEADTGCLISCISYELYKKLFSHIPLCKHNLVMSYYTGETVRPIGKISPVVRYKKKTCKSLDLYVIANGRKPLVGRRWLHEFGIVLKEVSCNDLKCNLPFTIESLSSRYSEVFAEGLGRYTGGEVSLYVREGARPVYMRARPLAYALREPVERALDQLVADGVITPVETSDWATPIVPVVKSDGTIRVCGDFKLTLNKCLEVDRFPLPKVEDLLAKLGGGEKFTKIDLSQAYAQFVLDKESQKYAVINTHRGLFRYERLVYGLSSSPGIFQRKLEQMFADIPRVGVFLDDVIISGRNDQEHLETLHKVLQRLQHYGLKIKKSKC